MQENTLCSCFEVQKWNMCSSSQSFVSRASCLAVTVEVHQWVESRGKSSARVCLDGGQQGKGKEHLEGNWVLSSISITFWWWDRWQYIWGDFPCLSVRDHLKKKKSTGNKCKQMGGQSYEFVESWKTLRRKWMSLASVSKLKLVLKAFTSKVLSFHVNSCFSFWTIEDP